MSIVFGEASFFLYLSFNDRVASSWVIISSPIISQSNKSKKKDSCIFSGEKPTRCNVEREIRDVMHLKSRYLSCRIYSFDRFRLVKCMVHLQHTKLCSHFHENWNQISALQFHNGKRWGSAHLSTHFVQLFNIIYIIALINFCLTKLIKQNAIVFVCEIIQSAEFCGFFCFNFLRIAVYGRSDTIRAFEETLCMQEW